jgi:hypothetical protein
MGGFVPLGYDVKDRKLVINKAEAKTVKAVFERFARVPEPKNGLWSVFTIRSMSTNLASAGR